MKKYTYIALAVLLSITSISCKKFLNIVPADNLSGNNFWQNKKDVEAFTNGLYNSLRGKIGNGLVTLGDLRFSAISTGDGNYGALLSSNNLNTLINNSSGGWGGQATAATQWKPFFDIITSANLLYQKVDEVPSGKLSEQDIKRYKAEAVFVRNLCYFFMVRLYGDVPYYTAPFNATPFGRTPMLQVVRKCLNDLNAVKADLPWSYSDPTMIGTRAMRGGAIALMMHFNMWGAGFDEDAKKRDYYLAVKDLATELSSSTDYALLPYTPEDNKRIFKGRTSESLFEIYQNFNSGEKLSDRSNLGYVLSHYPYLGTESMHESRGYFKKKFMSKIYSDGEPDLRKDLWFENIESDSRSFQFKKYANVYVNGITVQNDDDLIIFRLSDAYLLAAEAYANLDEDIEARRYLNIVRNRAGATEITSGGGDLKNQIYWERVRELMGEGHYYYDLVRTKRILDKDYVETPMTVSAFNAGAWTWPIDASALTDNPNMTLNNYWR